MLNESSVVVTLYPHTAKFAVKTFVIKQLQISKSAHFACLAWRAEYSNRFSFAAGIMVPSWTLNTGSYDAGTWPTPRCHSEVCLWWTLWRKLLEGRLLTGTHTIEQIMQKLSINSQQTKKCNCWWKSRRLQTAHRGTELIKSWKTFYTCFSKI